MNLIIAIIIGAIAGWLAGLVMKGSGYGFIINAILGIVGSFVGSWLFTQLNINLALGNGIVETIIVSAIGAVVVLFVAGLFKR